MEDQNTKVRMKFDLPKGYRFHPLDSELIEHYLFSKVTKGVSHLYIINEADVYAYQPFNIPGMDFEEQEGYYYTKINKKNPKGRNANRLVHERSDKTVKGEGSEHQGYWKMSVPHVVTDHNGRVLGMKKFFNYFTSFNVKTDWKMYEYSLENSCLLPANKRERNELVLCRVYRTKESCKTKKTEVLNHCRRRCRKTKSMEVNHYDEFEQLLAPAAEEQPLKLLRGSCSTSVLPSLVDANLWIPSPPEPQLMHSEFINNTEYCYTNPGTSSCYTCATLQSFTGEKRPEVEETLFQQFETIVQSQQLEDHSFAVNSLQQFEPIAPTTQSQQLQDESFAQISLQQSEPLNAPSNLNSPRMAD